MKLRLRRKRRKPVLMLTSLLDMFTIILIFLIVSFEAEDQEFRLNTDLELPESSARAPFKPAANVAITQRGVSIEGAPVVALEAGRGAPEWYVGDGGIPPLVKSLRTLRTARDDRVEDEAGESIVMLQADKDLDYATLYLVMRSARLAGFDKYRLAVLKK